jgi:hypothetical protein
MPGAHDVEFFDLDYCQADLSKIATAIKGRASLLVIGMPGCGKSRLIDFLLHRSGVLEKYGLANNFRFITVDGDILTANPQDIYVRLWQALSHQVQARPEGGVDTLKDQLMAEVEKLETEVDLVVIFDNFSRQLQRALGEGFFNFLYGLRNIRPKLNISYIFMANLKIDFAGFYKVDRLFNQGADRSVCWLSLLDKRDTFFSIERQWRKRKEGDSRLNEDYKQEMKERIYELTGGHALLTRYLSHLMMSGEVLVGTEPVQILEHDGIRAACGAIWNDLEQTHKNLLIDLATNDLPLTRASKPVKALTNYNLLTDQAHFFSPVFECFVKGQGKAGEVMSVGCDKTKTRLVIQTIDDRQVSFALNRLTQKKRELLCYLAANLGETCTKDQLKDIGWPADDKEWVSDQALSRQIDDIRKWLKQQRQLSQYLEIEADWGVGYRLALKD